MYLNEHLISKAGKYAATFLTVGIIFTSFQLALAYNQFSTHPALTIEMAKLFNAQNSATAYKLSRQDIESMVRGSIEEDAVPRWINHFYDPIHNKGWTGNHFGDLDRVTGYLRGAGIAPKPAIASINWAQNQEYQSAYGRQFGNQTWQKAIASYLNGDRKRAFLALGHTLHLIEDASVPDHTRDDSHPGIEGDPGSPYEDFTKTFTDVNDLVVVDVLVNAKTKIPDFIDLPSAFNFIALYSNNNFFSEDTISNEEYSLPGLNDVKKFKTVVNNDAIIYLEKNGIYLALFNKLAEKYSLADVNLVLPSYRDHLFPNVVLTGAGVVELFFREIEAYRNGVKILPKIISDSDTPFLESIWPGVKGAIIESYEKLENIITGDKAAVDIGLQNLANALGRFGPYIDMAADRISNIFTNSIKSIVNLDQKINNSLTDKLFALFFKPQFDASHLSPPLKYFTPATTTLSVALLPNTNSGLLSSMYQPAALAPVAGEFGGDITRPVEPSAPSGAFVVLPPTITMLASTTRLASGNSSPLLITSLNNIPSQESQILSAALVAAETAISKAGPYQTSAALGLALSLTLGAIGYTIRPKNGQTWEIVKQVPRTVYDTITETMERAVPVITTVYNQVKQTAYRTVFKPVQSALTQAVNATNSLFTAPFAKTIWQPITTAYEAVRNIPKTSLTYLKDTYAVIKQVARTVWDEAIVGTISAEAPVANTTPAVHNIGVNYSQYIFRDPQTNKLWTNWGSAARELTGGISSLGIDASRIQSRPFTPFNNNAGGSWDVNRFQSAALGAFENNLAHLESNSVGEERQKASSPNNVYVIKNGNSRIIKRTDLANYQSVGWQVAQYPGLPPVETSPAQANNNAAVKARMEAERQGNLRLVFNENIGRMPAPALNPLDPYNTGRIYNPNVDATRGHYVYNNQGGISWYDPAPLAVASIPLSDAETKTKISWAPTPVAAVAQPTSIVVTTPAQVSSPSILSKVVNGIVKVATNVIDFATLGFFSQAFNDIDRVTNRISEEGVSLKSAAGLFGTLVTAPLKIGVAALATVITVTELAALLAAPFAALPALQKLFNPASPVARLARDEAGVMRLGKNLAKPIATDQILQKNYIDQLFKLSDKILGGTAGAIRHELKTGELVGGRSHILKGQNMVSGLENWLKNNPVVSLSDRQTAQSIINDLKNALVGN